MHCEGGGGASCVVGAQEERGGRDAPKEKLVLPPGQRNIIYQTKANLNISLRGVRKTKHGKLRKFLHAA